MKSFNKLITLFFITQLFNFTAAFAQCTFVSTTGYTVTISIQPVNMLVTPNGGGCVYKTELQYNIQFSGNNIPSSLYTLQGNVTCYGQNRTYDLPNSGGAGTTLSANFSGPFINGNCSGYTKNGCTVTNIIIQGPGIPYQVVPCTFVEFPNPLPAELIDFTATENSQGVEIEWSTASERNNDYFTIEHSTDGINFTSIETVKGAGDSKETLTYSITLSEANFGMNYYRLKQTNYDGETTNLGTITLNAQSSSSKQYSLYPNPSSDRKITLFVSNPADEISYTIYSVYGQKLESKTLINSANKNTIELPLTGAAFILEIYNGSTYVGKEFVFAN